MVVQVMNLTEICWFGELNNLGKMLGWFFFKEKSFNLIFLLYDQMLKFSRYG